MIYDGTGAHTFAIQVALHLATFKGDELMVDVVVMGNLLGDKLSGKLEFTLFSIVVVVVVVVEPLVSNEDAVVDVVVVVVLLIMDVLLSAFPILFSDDIDMSTSPASL